MQKTFLKHIVIFFIPVIVVCAAVEYFVRELPESYKYNAHHLEKQAKNIQVLVLGTSQAMNAINAELLETPSINMASGDQHQDTDFKIAKALLTRLPKLKTVVLEVSYNHLEMPHNGPEFWKNSVYLNYYGINNFNRPTYFKDRSLFLAQHTLFSKKLFKHYFKNEQSSGFNPFGFDTLNYTGNFKKLNYNEREIKKRNFKINLVPNLTVFETNSGHLLKMLDYFRSKNIQVIIVQTPMYKLFLEKRDKQILLRKDNVMEQIKLEYPEVIHLNSEEDTLQFDAKDFKNPSHLNPRGATKFSKMLSDTINKYY